MAKAFAKMKQTLTTSLIKGSIFDDGTSSLWEKTTFNPQEESQNIIICQEMFFKKSKKKKEPKKIFFRLCDEYMSYIKEKKNIKVLKKLFFSNTKASFREDGDFDNSPSNEVFSKSISYFLKFNKNNQITEIYTQDVKIFQSWKRFLRYKCILNSFHDDFDVRKMIGKGSFAKVYLGVKKDNGDEFAVKAFSKENICTQNKGKESLINEISIMRKLNHPNIIKLYEIYETTHSIYLIIELIKGGELMKKIKEKVQYSFFDIQLFMKNLLEAIQHMHSKRFMHRDLKPENLLLRTGENIYDIVLADFGLSSPIDIKANEVLFRRCGTPGFVAPEILNFKEGQANLYNEKCDIFSAGVIFYILLTGKKPFASPDYKEILRLNRSCEIDFQKDIFKMLPKYTLDLLKRMMMVFPQLRISAFDGLDHQFFDNFKKSVISSISTKDNSGQFDFLEKAKANLLEYNSFNLSNNSGSCNNYEMKNDFKDNILNQENKDSIDSIKLIYRTPIFNGNTDTIEKISPGLNSNMSLSSASLKLRSPNSKLNKCNLDNINKKSNNDFNESPSHFSGKKKQMNLSQTKEKELNDYYKEMLEQSKNFNPNNKEDSEELDNDFDIPNEDPIVTKNWPEMKEFEKKNIELN